MNRTVVIDCFPESVAAYDDSYTIVAVDVIRATTMAMTAVALGRRCFPVPSLEAALELCSRLDNPLMAGELGGNMPYGFDMNNSPAELEDRADVERPMVLLSTSGTRLMCSASDTNHSYVASLRNYRAQVEHLAGFESPVVVIGAGSRGEFREEDQLCCAWIAEGLIDRGYTSGDSKTSATVKRWSGSSPAVIKEGHSAKYLCRSGQERDLQYVLGHIDDLENIYGLAEGEIVESPVGSLLR